MKVLAIFQENFIKLGGRYKMILRVKNLKKCKTTPLLQLSTKEYPNGTMRITGKSKLHHELEFKGSAVPSLPSHPKSEEKSITVIDFMAIVQKVLAIAKPRSINETQTSIE